VDVEGDDEDEVAAKRRKVEEELEREVVGKGKGRQMGNRKVELKSVETVGTETEEGGEEEKKVVDDDKGTVVVGNEETEDGEISEEK
jgi:hypothetical protein